MFEKEQVVLQHYLTQAEMGTTLLFHTTVVAVAAPPPGLASISVSQSPMPDSSAPPTNAEDAPPATDTPVAEGTGLEIATEGPGEDSAAEGGLDTGDSQARPQSPPQLTGPPPKWLYSRTVHLAKHTTLPEPDKKDQSIDRAQVHTSAPSAVAEQDDEQPDTQGRAMYFIKTVDKYVGWVRKCGMAWFAPSIMFHHGLVMCCLVGAGN
jgi:hypothetical protein